MVTHPVYGCDRLSIHRDSPDVVFDDGYWRSVRLPRDPYSLPLTTRYLWTECELDTDSGLQHRARYFDPTVGRWLSEDSLGFDTDDGASCLYPSCRSPLGLLKVDGDGK